MNEQIFLQIDNLSYFRGSNTTLKEISFAVRSNEILGVIGESGSGKTTLLKLLIAALRPQSGCVKLNGKEIDFGSRKQIKELRRKVQIVYQDAGGSLNPRHLIKNILLEPLIVHSIDKERSQLILSILKDLQLSESILDKYPYQLSGGEQQRVAIARALILRPQCLLLDESLAALDTYNQRKILDLLKELQSKWSNSIVYVSHDLASVSYLCHRIILLKDGSIVSDQNKEDFFNKPSSEYGAKLIEALL